MKSNEPQKVLHDICITHGPSILDDPQRIKGFLSDLCPLRKREINLLMAALAERIPQALINARSIPVEVLSEQFIKKLHDHHGISSEFAKWTIDAWKSALNIGSSQHILQTKTVVSNENLQSKNEVIKNKTLNSRIGKTPKRCPHCSNTTIIMNGENLNNLKCNRCNGYLDLKKHCESGKYMDENRRHTNYKFEKFGKLHFGALFFLPDGTALTKLSVRLASDNTKDYQMKAEDFVIIIDR